MSMRPPRYLKARPPGSSQHKIWHNQASASFSTKPEDVSALIEEDLNNSQFLEVNNRKIFFSELPKKGFRHVGFKQLGLKKQIKHINGKAELPVVNLHRASKSNLTNKSSSSIQPPPVPNQPFNHKKNGFIVGYQFEAMGKTRASVNQSFERPQRPFTQADSSFEYGNTVESSRVETKPEATSTSMDFTEAKLQKERIKRIVSQDESFSGKVHFRSLTRSSIEKSVSTKGQSLRYLSFLKEKLHSDNLLKNAINDKQEGHSKSQPSGLKPVVAMPFNNFQSEVNDSQAFNTEESNMDRSKSEIENFEKKNFIKMIYKKIGRGSEGYGRDTSFEQYCEHSRVSFESRMKKKLSNLKKL